MRPTRSAGSRGLLLAVTAQVRCIRPLRGRLQRLADVEQLLDLLDLLDRFVDSGNSVIVIERHQAVMAHTDWIIDLGSDAGEDCGRVVFEGAPADLVATLTGERLASYVG